MSFDGASVKQPTTDHVRDPSGIDFFRLRAGRAVAELAPGRGGLITRFAVDGDEILYLDRKTFLDRKQNVRGGIPVLFPIAGRLTGDRYQALGQSFPMRQHGLARHANWEVMDVEQARVSMEFRSSPASKVNFPFDFVLRMSVDLGRAGFRTLGLEISITNTGSQPMPTHFGLHPYFFVPDHDRDRIRVEVDAQYAFNNNTGESGPWNGHVDLTQPSVDLHLSDLQSQTSLIHIPGRPPRRIEMSDFFTTVVLWQSPLHDFLCVEPWSAPSDALNTGVCLRTLEPGDSLSGEVIISV